MSRIQDILNKAERDGTARRTRSLTGPTPATAVTATPAAAVPALHEAVAPATSVAPPPAPAWTPPAYPAPAPSVVHEAPTFGGAATARAHEAPTFTPPAPPAADTASVPASHGRLDQHLVAALSPTSLAAEQYRSLRTRIKRAENGRGVRSIVVTSPSKGDGKSLTAANLALTMAQEFQQRVLLVDADLRRPSVHRLFGLTDGPGLADVLMGVADLEHALVHLPEYHLTLLPAGVPPGNPAELLGSAMMRRVLDTLRTRFDRVLIDMPPVAPLADVQVVSPMTDGLLMIVRAGITPKPAIERALAGLDQTRVLGLVLNEAGDSGLDGAYEGYGYIAG
jgi:capsular exopolysaccharide synthesis family protein